MIYAIIFYLGRNKHKNSFWRTLMYSTKTRRGDYTWNETLSSEQNKAKTPPGVKIDTEACKQKLQFISFPLDKNVFSYKGGNQRSLLMKPFSCVLHAHKAPCVLPNPAIKLQSSFQKAANKYI